MSCFLLFCSRPPLQSVSSQLAVAAGVVCLCFDLETNISTGILASVCQTVKTALTVWRCFPSTFPTWKRESSEKAGTDSLICSAVISTLPLWSLLLDKEEPESDGHRDIVRIVHRFLSKKMTEDYSLVSFR